MNKIIYYETLGDFLSDKVQSQQWQYVAQYMADNCSNIYISESFDNLDTTYFPLVWQILMARHWKDYIAKVGYFFPETLEDDFEADFTSGEEDWLTFFIQKYYETSERYLTLLGFYSTYKDNLMGQISSTNKVKFNDTPQNGGDFDNDGHLTNITTTEMSSDMLPLINRLDEIQKLYRNTIKEWADEFEGLFMKGGANDYDEN